MAHTLEHPPTTPGVTLTSAPGVRSPETILREFSAYEGQRRLIILDPSLHGEVGHHFNHVRALAAAAERQRVPTIVLSYTLCDERVRAVLPVVPHFGLHPYAKLQLHTSTEEDFATHNELFLHYLANLPVRVTAQDVVLFPTVNHNQLLAIPAWMVNLYTQSACPQVVIGLMFGPDWVSWTERDDTQRVMYQRAFDAWPSVIRNRIRLICETNGVAATYERMSGVRPLVAPAPTVSIAQSVPRQPVRCALGHFVVGYMGHARKEKGVHLLPGIVAQTQRYSASTQFRIQMNYPAETPLTQQVREHLSQRETVMPLVLGALDERDYARFIDQCHVMLLPYSPVRYQTRWSGLLREALQRGRPVIAPANTEIGDYVIRHGVGTTFEAFTPGSIAMAVHLARQHYHRLQAAAERLSTQLDQVNEADEYVKFLIQGGVR